MHAYFMLRHSKCNLLRFKTKKALELYCARHDKVVQKAMKDCFYLAATSLASRSGGCCFILILLMPKSIKNFQCVHSIENTIKCLELLKRASKRIIHPRHIQKDLKVGPSDHRPPSKLVPPVIHPMSNCHKISLCHH